MRFDRGRAEWSPREKLAAGIILGLGLVLVVPTRGILLALGGVGLLAYSALQGAKAEEEKQRIPQLEGRIGALEEQFAPWRALEEYMPARIFREYSAAIEPLRHEVQQVARYWSPLADPLAARLEALARFLSGHNDAYFARQQEVHATFFSGQEFGIGKPFNVQQVRAILTNEYHTLVVAGPGAGKTQVITGRVAFYAFKKTVPPAQICVLAFNNSAAREVKERLQGGYGLEGIAVGTFHKLGLQVLRAARSAPVDVENNQDKVLGELLDAQLATNAPYAGRFLEYCAMFLKDQPFLAPPDVVEQMYAARAGESYVALDGTAVKSLAERDIANFFVRHDIPYEYERRADWVDPDLADPARSYHPDFYLPQWDAYLEHWAIDPSGSGLLPPWFTGGAAKYQAEQAWKRAQFRQHGKTLWETDYGDYKAGRLEAKLAQLLVAAGAEVRPLSYEALLEKLHLKRSKTTVLHHDLAHAVVAAKTFGYSSASLLSHLSALRQREGLRASADRYYDLVLPLFIAYEQYLAQHGKIDFADMINQATRVLREQPDLFRAAGFNFQMVLVDEFQDISLQRVQFLQALLALNPECHLCCVGDDWQAIYGFTGASAKYMVHFCTYFPDPARVDLELNYRNFPDVLQLGSEVIARCEVKLAKTLRAVKGAEKEPSPSPAPASSPTPSPSSPLASAPFSRAVSTPHIEFVRLDGGTDREFQEAQTECVCQLITRLLADGVEPAEIMVLSRFTFGLGAARDLVQARNLAPVETSKGSAVIRPGVRFTTIHKSKGLERDHVILLNAVSALFGFPPQIPSSFALRVLAPDVTDPLDEERRLFFVAVTRAKQAVHVCTWAENDSEFLLENPLFQTSTAATLTTVGFRGILLDATPDALHVKVEDPLRGLSIVPGTRLTIPRLMLYSPVDARPGEMQVIFVSRAWLATQSPPPVPASGGRSWNNTPSAARFSPSSGISSQNRTGVIFDCSTGTLRECLQRNLVGVPERQRTLYQYVRPGRLAFLLDVSQDQLVGIFETLSDIGMHLEMSAWGGRLPLQVRVRPLGSPIVVRHISSLWASVGVPTKIFSGRVVPEKKHLDRDTTRQLCELFKSPYL